MDDPISAEQQLHRKPLDHLNLGALQRILQICSMDVMLIDADDPHGTLGTLRQGSSIACTIEHDFSLRSRFIVPPEYFLLGYVHHAGHNSWSHANALQSSSAISLAAGVEADFMFGAGTRVTFLLREGAQLERLGLGRSLERDGLQRIFQAAVPGAPSRLGKIYQQLRWKILLQSNPAYATLMAQTVDFDRIIECHVSARQTCAQQSNGLPSRHRHYLIVQQVEKYLRNHLMQDIYLTHMCDVAKISERALRYAFDDLLGISPMRFLCMLRLCTASQSLSQADSRRRSVKSIAMDCGLRDLSRFAGSYRRVFGELPHDTLLRPPQSSSFLAQR